MTADAAACGATDNLVSLTDTLIGSLVLHNDRRNFSNTTTLVLARCLPVPSTNQAITFAAQPARGQQDSTGNAGQ